MSIKKHQDLINNHINSVYLPSINNLKLREIVEYSLLGGKRLRSMIVLDISYNLSKTYFYDMALSIVVFFGLFFSILFHFKIKEGYLIPIILVLAGLFLIFREFILPSPESEIEEEEDLELEIEEKEEE